MPIPSKPPLTAEEAYAETAVMGDNVLRVCEATRITITRGLPVRIVELVALFDTLVNARLRGESLAPTPGLEDFAKTVMGADYSITWWFTDTVRTGTNVNDWLIANLPSDGQGGIVLRKFVTGGQTADATIDPQQLEPLLPLLDGLITALKG